jgi:starch phosphorylase
MARTIAYFSMEIAVDPAIPTYAGGLGVLAGDTLRSAADMGLPMVGISLLYRKGYFKQELDPESGQRERPVDWSPEQRLEKVNAAVSIPIEGRLVRIRTWKYTVKGIGGHEVPVYFLDAAVPDNSTSDRALTDYLYGGDQTYRLSQEAILGLGGIAVLRALGLRDQVTYHMNEGHSSLLTLALLEERIGANPHTDADLQAVRSSTLFTTHTPVSAGHDLFPWDMVSRILGDDRASLLKSVQCCVDGGLDMTHLAMRFSRYINAVALRHGETARGLFPRHVIESITNGVHAPTWTSEPFQRIFDRHLPRWRRDATALRAARVIPLHQIREAHFEAKENLFDLVRARAGVRLSESVLTLGFARRATAYKRPELLLTGVDRLYSMARAIGPIQLVYAGKAHPRDAVGKGLIRSLLAASRSLQEPLRLVYLDDYDMSVARTLCAGVDVWVNNPIRPLEASGTSGMKAALNGVPSLSVLDGWWVEGHIEGVTGWSIGDGSEPRHDSAIEAARLYEKLERTVLPLYYTRTASFAEVMRSSIELNGSFFNTQRMLEQYAAYAYDSSEKP